MQVNRRKTTFVSEGAFEKQWEIGGWRPSEKLEMAGCTYINITKVLITKAVNTEYRTVDEAFLTFSDMLPSLLRC